MTTAYDWAAQVRQIRDLVLQLDTAIHQWEALQDERVAVQAIQSAITGKSDVLTDTDLTIADALVYQNCITALHAMLHAPVHKDAPLAETLEKLH